MPIKHSSTFIFDSLALESSEKTSKHSSEFLKPFGYSQNKVQSDWEEADSGSPAFIRNKPTLDPSRWEKDVITYQWGYGYLYNWWVTQEEVTSSADWGVPTDAQFTTLSNYVISLGYPNDYYDVFGVGNQLKSKRQVNSPYGGEFQTSIHPRWASHNTQYGHNLLNFDLFPAGIRSSEGQFMYLGLYAYLATKSTFSTGYNHRVVFYDYSVFYRSWFALMDGESIRLVRTATIDEQLLVDGTYCDDYIGNDGKRYKTVKIGTQVWIAANLAETKYRNGDLIPFEATLGQGNYSNAEWAALTTPARCAYSNNETYVSYEAPYNEESDSLIRPKINDEGIRPKVHVTHIEGLDADSIVELVSEDNTGHPVTTDTVLRISINGVLYEINAKTVV